MVRTVAQGGEALEYGQNRQFDIDIGRIDGRTNGTYENGGALAVSSGAKM